MRGNVNFRILETYVFYYDNAMYLPFLHELSQYHWYVEKMCFHWTSIEEESKNLCAGKAQNNMHMLPGATSKYDNVMHGTCIVDRRQFPQMQNAFRGAQCLFVQLINRRLGRLSGLVGSRAVNRSAEITSSSNAGERWTRIMICQARLVLTGLHLRYGLFHVDNGTVGIDNKYIMGNPEFQVFL